MVLHFHSLNKDFPMQQSEHGISWLIQSFYSEWFANLISMRDNKTFSCWFLKKVRKNCYFFLGAACNPNSRATFQYALRVHGMETAELITITCQLPAALSPKSNANMLVSWNIFLVITISWISTKLKSV